MEFSEHLISTRQSVTTVGIIDLPLELAGGEEIGDSCPYVGTAMSRVATSAATTASLALAQSPYSGIDGALPSFGVGLNDGSGRSNRNAAVLDRLQLVGMGRAALCQLRISDRCFA